ncbi:hypothetical protein AVEN_273414-1 [Araneus ventricosus]|uniref:Secreted protein n=1 Tax=Araneus ventricosus TaxID=182803 RepID=A0A4Y2E2W7_ARAVE|nr:hypothetical protein AVEN_273414-1 [Araneus ventricosus]
MEICNVVRHWYILLLHTVTMVVETFVPSVHQRIETGTGELSIKVVEPRQDGLLRFGIDSEMLTSQVLLQRSKEMKVTWCEVRVVGRVFQ